MKDYTDVTILLDHSGSMDSIKEDVIGGMRSFIKEQAALEGTCFLTLIQFDSVNSQEVTIKGRNIREAAFEKFEPRGSTPLLDALGDAIENTGKRLALIPENERPNKVAFVVYTDGEENCSSRFSKERVKAMMDEQRTKYNWQFVFLGTDFDVFAEASSLGYAKATTFSFAKNAAGVAESFSNATIGLRNLRRGTSATYSVNPDEDSSLKE